MRKNCAYSIDGLPVTLEVEGQFGFGKDEVLLLKDDNLFQNTPWNEPGYTVAPFLDTELFNQLLHGIKQQFIARLRAIGISVDDHFDLEKYHTIVDEKQHAQMVESFKNYIDSDQLPIPLHYITDRISEILGLKVNNIAPERGEFYFIRFVRPSKQDFNPPHRDTYLDRIRNAVNIYVPLWGSNQLSSLPILPGSHRFMESEVERTINGGPIVNGVRFTVPCITETKSAFSLIRPNPCENEVLVFSPYLIHGGAANLNSDITRFSLEMRFWRA